MTFSKVFAGTIWVTSAFDGFRSFRSIKLRLSTLLQTSALFFSRSSAKSYSNKAFQHFFCGLWKVYLHPTTNCPLLMARKTVGNFDLRSVIGAKTLTAIILKQFSSSSWVSNMAAAFWDKWKRFYQKCFFLLLCRKSFQPIFVIKSTFRLSYAVWSRHEFILVFVWR